MGVDTELMMKNWWAEGDIAVHTNSRAAYFVDGRSAMLTFCLHFLKARKYIYIASWGMTPDLELVRGNDHRAGPDGSPEQDTLMARLRARGLEQADIDFWCTHELSVQAVLGYAMSKGVEVKVLLWCGPELPVLVHDRPRDAQRQLLEVGVTCILDDSAHGIVHHPFESMHQKISIVDGTHAFVGGIDPLIELSGEFDRWDSPSHPFSSPIRRTKVGTSPHPWHDAHALIEGPAARDVEHNFRQRWNSVVERHASKDLLLPEHPPALPLESKIIMQVARTIPQRTYHLELDAGIQGIAQQYINALGNAQRFIYLENQYFWLHAGIGIVLPPLGRESLAMEHITLELADALRRGVTVALVLPDHPNVGRPDTDASLVHLRREAPEAIAQGRLQVFCLGSSTPQEDGEHYRPIYVHAKVAIIDDLWTTVGSANLNNRGMRDDTEMNVTTLDTELAQGLRLMLWAEHLGLVSEEDLFGIAGYLGKQYQSVEDEVQAKQVYKSLQEILGDPLVGLSLMTECAQDNLRRYKARQPLVGHLLPYLTVHEARQHGLHFREEHGWLEEA
jgi:phosphatidylserine/phosphatidylglycerophosphate/cardiolipin synthase-like enzyme